MFSFLRTKNREQKTEDKKQRTKNRGQKTENKKQRTKNREQKTENKKKSRRGFTSPLPKGGVFVTLYTP